MTLLFLYLCVALIVSFLCSIAEAVLLSVPFPYLKSRAEKGIDSAREMMNMKLHVDKPLSAILSLNTIAHTVGAAGVGAQAVHVFSDAYFGIVSAVMTILILVLTEILPKTLGASYCKELSGVVARLLQIMILISYPFVIGSSYLTKFLSGRNKKHTASREEISAMANMGVEHGTVSDKENKIIQNLIRLKSIRASDIMTPRVVVVIADENMGVREFLARKDFLHFSRIPVYHENRDNITGYVFRELVFEKLAEDQFDLQLKNLKRDIVTLPESTTLFAAWEILLKSKEHISLIVDEYGGMAGIVTLEDIIETLLGIEIVDEKDTVEDMQHYAMERWKSKQKKYKYLSGGGIGEV